MENQDIRWIQRFANYRKAVAQLSRFIENAPLNELEEQGLIQCFEYTYELAWNTIKDFYESQGETEIQGSRDAIRLAFKRGLIENGETWMKMIKSRTLTAHTYNEGVASEISKAVFDHYYPEFILLMDKFNGLKEKESNRI
ncbi:MAG: nucleotidyltransferase substrate binding protein [Desulfosalsimonadaceae bacterium]